MYGRFALLLKIIAASEILIKFVLSAKIIRILHQKQSFSYHSMGRKLHLQKTIKVLCTETSSILFLAQACSGTATSNETERKR